MRMVALAVSVVAATMSLAAQAQRLRPLDSSGRITYSSAQVSQRPDTAPPTASWRSGP